MELDRCLSVGCIEVEVECRLERRLVSGKGLSVDWLEWS